MNCRQAETQLFAERDGALDATQRAVLAQHLEQCAACRKLRETFSSAIDSLRTATAQARVPDAELEWQQLRREIRGGAGSTRRSTPLTWFGLPLAAAAAAAVVFYMNTPSANQGDKADSTQIAAAAVNEPAPNSSTIVLVDDQSGYVFVWSDEAKNL